MLFNTVSLAAIMVTGAFALPAPASELLARSSHSGNFTLMVTNCDNSALNNLAINATDQALYINRPTTTFCENDCAPYSDITVLTAHNDGSLSLGVAVAGGQKLYVEQDGEGTLQWTSPNSGFEPVDSKIFDYLSDYGPNTFGSLTATGSASGFLACDLGDGSFTVKVALVGDTVPAACVRMTIATYVYDGYGAYQHV